MRVMIVYINVLMIVNENSDNENNKGGDEGDDSE